MIDFDDMSILALSLQVALTATVAILPIGVALAWLLAGWRGRGRILLESLLTLPLVLPPTAIGIVLLMLLSEDSALGRVLSGAGVEIMFTWKAAALASAVMSLPLLVRSARTAFEEIDPRLLGVARTLGDGPWRVFRRVALPLAWRGIRSGHALVVLPCARRVRSHHPHRREHPRTNADLGLGHFSSFAGGARRRRAPARGCDLLRRTRRGLRHRTTRPAARGRSIRTMIDLSIRLALAPFTLEAELALAGRVTAVLGPSGSGKTSLLEIIAGLRRRAEGRATLDGVTLLDSERRIHLSPERRQIGYVPQEPALFPHLDVAANVRYGLRSHSGESNRRVAETLALLEISELQARYPRTLSGGEAQRVALARALVTKPRLLLLDEPLAALDAELRHRILPYLMRVRDEAKIPMIHVTHHVGEALALADEAVVLRAGRVEATGPVRYVLTPKLVTSVRSDATFENIVHGVVTDVDDDGGTAKLTPLVAASGETAVGAPLLTVPAFRGLERRSQATYRVASEDVLLLSGAPAGISARNVFAARVVGVEALRTDVLVRLATGTLEWRALVTAVAVRELEIAAGRELFIAIKTHSFDRLG